jgi:hypothetical protein
LTTTQLVAVARALLLDPVALLARTFFPATHGRIEIRQLRLTARY